MSSSDAFRAAGALLLALGLGGCFQPLYGEAAHPGLVADMRAIEVAPISDRIGHYLGDNLIASFNGTGSPVTVRMFHSRKSPADSSVRTR